MTGRLLAVTLLLAGSAGAQAPDVAPEAYRHAASVGAVGALRGRAYAERRTPGGAESPLTGTVVTLLPRSAELVERLELIRATARDSQRAFRAAATELRRTREDYESRLWEAGFPELAKTMLVDGAGGYSMTEVPAGEWVLIATRSVFVNRQSPQMSPRDRGTFVPGPRLVGYYAVSVWVRELTISGGAAETLDLMDRDVWFTGIVEDRTLDAGP